MRLFISRNLCWCLLSCIPFNNGYAAITQFLNDSFFQNPAELNKVFQSQFTLGSVFINPYVQYEGGANGRVGEVSSNVYSTLPYILSGYRVNEKWVVGLNVLPSAYANIQWPEDSFISQITTTTKALYYRIGFQSSYKLSERWYLGAGFNIEDNAQYYLNFVVPGQGNQMNSITGVNYTGDAGVYYKINEYNYLTFAGYTQVNTYGHGTSSTPTALSSSLSFNITEAPVIYLGLQHIIRSVWFLEEKIYWSGWSIQHNINFSNTTNGTYTLPTNWRDVWSFQINTRYALNKTYALLGSVNYDSNPVPLETNSIGYPLAASGSLSAGLDLAFGKKYSVQGIYTYGKFLPNSPINNSNSQGVVHSHVQAGIIQFNYKT